MFASVINIIVAFCLISCLGFSNYKAAKDIKLLTKERFLNSCQKYQSTEINAEVDLEGFGLPSRTMSITSLVRFVSDNPDVASVTSNILSGNSIGTSTISIAISPSARGTILTPATVEVTDLSTSVESLSVAAVTGVGLFAPDNTTRSSGTVTPTVGVRQDLHSVGDRANISVYANFDDGTYMDVTQDTNVESLSHLLNITTDAVGPQVVVLGSEPVDSYLLLAEYQTCPGRVVTGVGRVVVMPHHLATATPSAAPSASSTNASSVVTVAPSVFPSHMPTPYESLGLPTSLPSMLAATAAPTSTGVPSALPTSILSHYPSSVITQAPTAQPTDKPREKPTAEPSAQPSEKPNAPTGQPSATPSATPSAGKEASTAPSSLPTGTPTVPPSLLTPTVVQTAVPSGAPTSSPTQREEGPAAATASAFTYLVHPEINIVSGGGFPVRAAPVLSGMSTWALPFGLMTETAQHTHTVGITVGGRRVGSQEFHVHGEPIASVAAVCKTPVVYASERVLAVTYQVRDSAGSTLVEPGEAVHLQVRSPVGAVITIDCLSPEVPSGIASCTGVLPTAWFVVSGAPRSVEAVVSTARGILSDPLQVTLVATPQYAVAPPGLLVTMPTAPVFAGSAFTVDISASTTEPLTAWKLSLLYDHAVLEVLRVDTAPSYSPAAAVRTTGSTKLSCRGINPSTTLSEVNGSAVSLAAVRFVVREGADAALYDAALRLVVIDLVKSDESTQAAPMSAPVPGHFRDRRQVGNYDSGQLVVKRREYVGLLPFAVQTELVDTGALNGVAVMSPIVSAGVSNDPDAVDYADLTAHSSCGNFVAVGGPSAVPVTVAGCVVSTTKGCTVGSKSIPVPVTYSGSNSSAPLEGAVAFRVWCASTISVKVLDKVLNAIEI